MTANTALRLSRYFGTTPQLWLNLQKAFELRLAEIESGKDIAKRVQPGGEAAPNLALSRRVSIYEEEGSGDEQ